MAKHPVDSGISVRTWALLALAVLSLGGSLLFAQSGLPTPEGEPVVEVRVVGNQTIPPEKILPLVRTRAGRPFDVRLVEEDVRRLSRSGMFINVRPYSQQVPAGKVVIFEVVERPVLLEVKYVGNKKIKKKDLEKETALKPGDPVDPFEIEMARRKIEEYYQRKGFGKVRVTLFEGSKPTDRRAIFLIHEGPKQKIFWTSFVGNTIASDARLKTQIKSKPPILYLFKGEVDREQIDEDVKRLTAYYRSLGFFRARVGRELDFDEDQEWLTLTFVIDEGPRFEVREVSFLGNSVFDGRKLAEDVKLKNGEYFDQKQATADVSKLVERYGSIGYIFADVKADTRIVDERGVLDLVYKIQEGDQYRVGKITPQIRGDFPHTRLSTVLNRISLHPGDIVDIRELRASEARLRGSGLFLVDPVSGDVPKIVYNPPEVDEETEVANRPRYRTNYRGQSPDPAPAGYGRQIAPARPAEHVVDLTLRATAADASPPAAPYRSGFAPPVSPAAGQGRTIVRGQDGYDPNLGRSLPSLAPRPSLPSSAPTSGGSTLSVRPPAAYQPAASPSATYPSAAAPAGSAWQDPPPFSPGPGSATSAPGAYASPPAAAPGPATGYSAAPPSAAPVYSAPVYSAPPSGLPPAFPPGPAPAASAPPVGSQFPVEPDPAGPGGVTQPFPMYPGAGATEPLWTAPGAPPPARDIDLFPRVTETQTGKLMFGVGVNSDSGLMGSFVLDEQNFDWRRVSWQDLRNGTLFRGGGQRLRIEAVPGTEVQRYMASFQEPYLLSTDISLSLSGFYYDRQYYEWSETRLGGRVALGYHFTPYLSGSLTYRGEKVTVYDPITPPGVLPDLDEVLGDNVLHGFGATLAHDTRDSPFLATEGHLIEASFEQVIGTFEYPRGELDLRQYFLLHQRPDGSGRHVLSLTGRVGVSGSETPIYDRYFAGGFSTIRGFDFRGASPVKVGVPVGGDFILLASAEYMFPITADDFLRAVVFCDTGTVEPSMDDWADKYRVAPGFGLRIMIPAMGPAPIALDFAFPVSKNGFDREQVFSFFFGLLR